MNIYIYRRTFYSEKRREQHKNHVKSANAHFIRRLVIALMKWNERPCIVVFV
jgi:hypothetical protein